MSKSRLEDALAQQPESFWKRPVLISLPLPESLTTPMQHTRNDTLVPIFSRALLSNQPGVESAHHAISSVH